MDLTALLFNVIVFKRGPLSSLTGMLQHLSKVDCN